MWAALWLAVGPSCGGDGGIEFNRDVRPVLARNCFPCHGMQMEGGIGPSFVDEEWIHGGQAANIVATD